MNLREFIKQTRELCEAATPGPWQERFIHYKEDWPDGKTYNTVAAHGPLHKVASENGVGQSGKDMTFIAASRSSLPLALDLLEMAVDCLDFYGRGDNTIATATGTYIVESGQKARNTRAAMADKLKGEA